MNRATMITAAAAAVLTGTAPAGAQVLDGGFENTTVNAQGFANYAPGDRIGAWAVAGATVSVLGSSYAETGVSFAPHGGNRALDLTGPGQTVSGSVFQDAATLAGQQYRLGFWIADTTGNGTGGTDGFFLNPATVGVEVGGGARQSFAVTAAFGTQAWRQFFVNFTASAASTRIAFFNTATNDSYAGLDDVTLEVVEAEAAVPEPATWGLMLAGFGLAGGALRRRDGSYRASGLST